MEIAEVIRLADNVRRDLAKIRTRETGAVMFVDLAGSTDYKAHHPDEDEWLPRLATFLLSATRIIETNGRVVKYIGDEVMGFFNGPDAILDAEHSAERVLQFCAQFTQYSFQAKVALDYGSVSMLDFVADKKVRFGRADPNGLTVDRCARIMSKTPGGVVLCSAPFRSASAAKTRWRSAGSFRAKGIPQIVKVFQMNYGSAASITVKDAKMTLEECSKRLAKTEGQLDELRAFRKGLPRRPRA